MAKIRKRFIIPLCCALIFVLGLRFFGAELFTLLALKYLDNNNYKSAYKLAKNAVFLEPDNKASRLVYIRALCGLPPSFSVQKEIFEFTLSKYKDGADVIAENKIQQWRDFAMEKTGSNYIKNAPLDTKIIRWNRESFPLSVSFSGDADVPEYYLMRSRLAFDTWEKESGGFFNFKFADSNGDIQVKFIPFNVSSGGERGHLGNPAFTAPDIKNNKLKKMTIFVHDRDRFGRYYPEKAVYTFVLHEIGHALGMMGHSQNANDLMYMSNMAAVVTGIEPSLSKDDLNTLKLLYNMSPDITNTDKINTKGLIYSPVVLGSQEDILREKIIEAEDYIKKAPFQIGGYVDLAVLYAKAEDYSSAKYTLDKGMSVAKNDFDRYIVNYNMAVLHMEMGAKQDALRYAKQAQAFNDNADIQSLIAEIQKS